MKIGFTGTRIGMTDVQRDSFTSWVESCDAKEFHHGDCIGADDQSANIVKVVSGALIISHPPDRNAMRAFNTHRDRLLPPKPYLERNQDIVDACDVLIACPAEMTEQQRGGTWSTVRYARKHGKRVVLILPSGEVQE